MSPTRPTRTLYCWRNVEQIESTPNQAILDVIHVEFAKKSFDVQACIADTKDYAIPQHRRRASMVCVCGARTAHFTANPDAFVQYVFSLLDSFKSDPCDLAECLLDSSHDVVQRELAARQARGPGQAFRPEHH